MFFDPLYFLFIAPGFLLALWASFKVKSTFRRYSEVSTQSGMSGAEVASEMLRRNGIRNVGIEEHQGFLSDHYDPSAAVVRLSPDVYHGKSVSSVGVAAHECGHVLQHVQGYAAMRIRQTLVGPASFGSSLSFIFIAIGFSLNTAGLIWLGIIAFSAVVLFQLITLPVEFNASSRAKEQLLQLGIVNQDEGKDVARVLNAAALTYVAALITSLLTLAYYLFRIFGTGRSDD